MNPPIVGDLLHLSYRPDCVKPGEEEVDVVVVQVHAGGHFDVTCADEPRPWTVFQDEIEGGEVVVSAAVTA